jgi:hypothetical protein
MKTFDHTVQATSGNAAASTSDTPAGTGSSWPAGTATRGGIPTAGEQRAGRVADRPTGHVRANRRHPTAALQPEVCRCSRGRGVVPLSLQQVGAVDASRDDLEEHLVGVGGGVRDLGEDERLGASGRGHGHGQHDSEPSQSPKSSHTPMISGRILTLSPENRTLAYVNLQPTPVRSH